MSLLIVACSPSAQSDSPTNEETSSTPPSISSERNFAELVNSWAKENEACVSANQVAGIEGKDVNDEGACSSADELSSELMRKGYCYGDGGDSTKPRSSWDWHKCTVSDKQPNNPVPANTPSYTDVILKTYTSKEWIDVWGRYEDRVNIQSQIDEDLSISDIKVNKGNCSYYSPGSFPVVIKFGEVLPIRLYDGCRVIRLDVETDMSFLQVYLSLRENH